MNKSESSKIRRLRMMDPSDIVKMSLYCNGGIPVKKLVLIFVNAGHFEIFDNVLLFEQFGLFVSPLNSFLIF